MITKRVTDIVGSMIALIVLSPMILFVACLVFIKIGRPVIYVSYRPGKDEVCFKLYKFRTMTNQTSSEGVLLPDAERLTKFGKWLRSTSLDELPELLNILKGDMSIVGPRPLLVEYLPLYNAFQCKRHLVRPGLTGWAQINGRNALNWQDRFIHDVWYVENRSFLLDMKIIAITFQTVLSRSGINDENSATMEGFKGN